MLPKSVEETLEIRLWFQVCNGDKSEAQSKLAAGKFTKLKTLVGATVKMKLPIMDIGGESSPRTARQDLLCSASVQFFVALRIFVAIYQWVWNHLSNRISENHICLTWDIGDN